MKKLNITPGPWVFIEQEHSNGQIYDSSCLGTIKQDEEYGPQEERYGFEVAAIWADVGEEAKNNAQAITAVPEMLEALIGARKDLLKWQKSFGADEETKDVLYDIESALKKAGCK